MFQPLVEFWQKTRCPRCSTENWTYHSHSQRCEPIRDPQICKCHQCSVRYWMMSAEQVRDFYPAERFDIDDGETLMDVCGADEETGRSAPRSN